MSPVNDFLSGKIYLPSPPAIAIKILETAREDNFTFKALADVIESDPALAARVLKAANSPYYNLACKVTSIEKSLAILGTHAVKNIALSFVICSELKREPYEAFDASNFWRHALSSAVAAELIATLVRAPGKDLFIIALLQDIGILVMHGYRPRYYQRVFNYKDESQLTLPEIERMIFGCDHQEVGAELLKKWLLPEEIYEPIRYHHQETVPPAKYRITTALLSIARDLSSFYNGSEDVDKIRRIKSILDTDFGIHGTAVDTLIESVADSTLELFSVFEITPGTIRPFSQILQEANAGLSELYDSYELQIIELKQAKEKLKKKTEELERANARLHELASRDGLTGVLNYRSFQEAMDREIIRSRRYGKEFSLISFDVDDFKRINTDYGHPAGDLVLIEICKVVGRTIRTTDCFARCGGDEFSVIMPETASDMAQVVAEHLRSCVNDLAIQVDHATIRAKISIGVASYDPTDATMDKKRLILMADRAQAQAKSSGKNRISLCTSTAMSGQTSRVTCG
ncbi:MAG: GGDEF domain-containing protein [Oryzomonas sp.]|uniref:sensor domain-containing diguanylate cyclase n=1 Tax=Oryzomonas sp. TaxID=2855186 RepID=UPI00284C1228|nr:GGDEF domain-containing protein [Oryzomonas sp.]MDR3578950.1 GGDEF domain-containing protein [Oryzomonas sp.]